jgi:hypothetical protein
MIDQTDNEGGREPERVGFCQDCGKPLTRETVRTVGSGVFCEPCLEVRLGTAAAANAGAPVGGSAPNWTEPLPPIGGSDPSPALAALLGLIPGVGAMYNGQFAKGIAHIVIFALLDSMAHVSGIFGLLVAGWVFYQSFEAYHTARARREGLPLPDPFGLNNIGEHVGVHFRGGVTGVPPNPGTQAPPPGAASNPWSYPASGWAGYPPPQQPIVTPPPEPVVGQAWGSVPAQPAVPYTQAAPVWDTPAWTPPAGQDWGDPASYHAARRANRFPGAAIWLIGFGLLFLILNFVPGLRFNIYKIFPFFLMGLGVLIFVRRMSTVARLSADDHEGLAARTALVLRGPAILFTLGLLEALQSFEVFRLSKTWPVLVIVIGLLTLFQRSVGSRVVPVVVVAPETNGDGKVV